MTDIEGPIGAVYLDGKKLADVHSIEATPRPPDFIDCPLGCGRAALRESDGRYWCGMGQHYAPPAGIDPDNPPPWYPTENVAGSSPYRNLRGCWFCGAKIEPLNGMCSGCEKDRPWTRPNPFVLADLVQQVHSSEPQWWVHGDGPGRYYCAVCHADDNPGPIHHKTACSVALLLAVLDPTP